MNGLHIEGKTPMISDAVYSLLEGRMTLGRTPRAKAVVPPGGLDSGQ